MPKGKIKTDKKELRNFIKRLNKQEKINLAKKEDTSPNTLQQLAQCNDLDILFPILENPNINRDTLLNLAASPLIAVRLLVSDNPKTSRAVLRKLAKDKDSEVQKTALNNPNYYRREKMPPTKNIFDFKNKKNDFPIDLPFLLNPELFSSTENKYFINSLLFLFGKKKLK